MTIGASLAEALGVGQRDKSEVPALLQLVGLLPNTPGVDHMDYQAVNNSVLRSPEPLPQNQNS